MLRNTTERERERQTHTHTHCALHILRERDRKREREAELRATDFFLLLIVIPEEVAVRLVVVATCLEWRCAALLEISYCEQFCFPSVDSSVFSLFSWSEEGSHRA